jgi:transcriptional regulator with XRE-family HTH domain
MTFPEQLRAEMERLDLTRKQTAELLSVSSSWVDKVLAGENTPLEITKEGALARLEKAKRKENEK